MEKLKKTIIQQIENCNDEEFLAEVLLMFDNKEGGLHEPEIIYHTNADYQIPQEHYQLLEEDMKKVKSGEMKTHTWEEVKARLVAKYDL